ncbi:Ig-like domain-containing protein [Yinghuangia sp. ASG 101]|uniref:L,D-transpeptidase n=1 Tax=Yinghuangia sp. ASG 101 TaxID=2896848 RepID=UPI001E3018F9|nr:Ig-like domain-containing protein [Yinghuangia sp. ASG 101]UGQ09979.1 Ig-like domain-containing protein [Yinghuangia sp. ASG 101]
MHGTTDTLGRRRTRRAIAMTAAATLALGGCSLTGGGSDAGPKPDKPAVSAARFTLTPQDGSDGVAPETVVSVGAGGGRLTEVALTAADGAPVAGTMSQGGASWRSTEPLGYGTAYTVRATAVDEDGLATTRTSTFTTATPKSLIGIKTITPENGATVGVGMPISVEFDHEIKSPVVRAAVEARLAVATSTPVEGAWGWVDDSTVRFRPKEYWPAGTKVSVTGNLRGLPMGDDGAYGADGSGVDFAVGSAVITTVDSAAHVMTVARDGEVLRTVPVTTGKPGFTTRSGTKVILGKEEHVLMDGTTVGIAEGSSDAYRLDVYWATRVTWSGEYLHAAPWSVGSQGVANVSHGCVGMSTEDARWYFGVVKVGDVVNVVNTGSDKAMETTGNGYGEWNLPFDRWLESSAAGAVTTGTPTAA